MIRGFSATWERDGTKEYIVLQSVELFLRLTTKEEDKKNLTKKSEKKVEMNTRRKCQHCGIPHFYINRKHIRAIIMSLSGNDTLILSGAMMVTFYSLYLSRERTNE